MKVTDLNYDECIHCETEEQAKLFLKNFEEQLELVKEFL